MKTMTAVGDNVIVEVFTLKEKKTEGGLVMPSAIDKESKSQGIVIAVGPDVTGINVGDVVIVSRMIGEVFHLGDRDFLATKKNDIFAILTEAN